MIPVFSFCQEITYKTNIDNIVDSIDSLSRFNSKSYINEKIVNSRKAIQKWQYFDNKELSLISIGYKIDSTSYTEKYYLYNGGLIYAYEEEIWYQPSLGINEYTMWSGTFYFVRGKLADHVTLGHGKSELDNWNPEQEILLRLKERKKELKSLK